MTANTSATRGYLSPVSTPPAEDTDLDDILSGVIVGVTGLDPTLVRPKWQEVPPAQPERAVTWCAFGVTVTEADVNPTLVHDGADDGGLGTSTESRTEFLEVTASFYGPACRGYATVLRDGLGIAQNRDAFRANGMGYVATERMTLVPELRNTQFIRRVDLVFRARRMVNRTYRIQNVLSVDGAILTDQGSVAGL